MSKPFAVDISQMGKVWYDVSNQGKERLDTMSKKLFTEEEIAAFRASPYVESVSAKSVTFTAEFKRLVYEKLLAGHSIETVLEAHGIDTAAMGQPRIRGMQEKLFKAAERDAGFANLRKQRKQSQEKPEESAQKRIRRLEAELAYTRQELDFLKKVRAANLEAQKAWESKHRRK